MTEYEKRIRSCFKQAYEYHERHKGIKSKEQFAKAWNEITALSDAKGDPFTLELMSAVYGHLARESKR